MTTRNIKSDKMKKINDSLSFRLVFFLVLLIAAQGCKKEGVKEDGSAKEKTMASASGSDPLPSWNDTKVKKDITAYIEDVTNSQSPNFIPVKDRIATFDND